MSRKRKFIPVEEAFAEWRKDPEYVAAYDALEEDDIKRNRFPKAPHAEVRAKRASKHPSG